MTKKGWLSRAKKAETEIKALEQEKRRAYEWACGGGSLTDRERVQTSKKNGAQESFLKFTEYSLLLDERLDELYRVKKEVIRAIEQVENPVYRTLLWLRHVSCQPWEKIALEMDYSYYYVTKELYRAALGALKVEGEEVRGMDRDSRNAADQKLVDAKRK